MREQGAETQPKDRQQADAESATTVNHRDFALPQASSYHELLGEINHAFAQDRRGPLWDLRSHRYAYSNKALKGDTLDPFQQRSRTKTRVPRKIVNPLRTASGRESALIRPRPQTRRQRKWRASDFFSAAAGARFSWYLSSFLRATLVLGVTQIFAPPQGNLWLRPKV